jgi:hypothetical protein
MDTSEVRQAREEIVRRHMAAENAHDYAATIATFSQPRYEIHDSPTTDRLRRRGDVDALGDPG